MAITQSYTLVSILCSGMDRLLSYRVRGGDYGTATATDVLAPKTIGTPDGILTGTIPDRGAGGTITPGTTNVTRQSGYYSSDIIVQGSAALVSGNIRKGVNLFGVTGNYAMQFVRESIIIPLNGTVGVTLPFDYGLFLAGTAIGTVAAWSGETIKSQDVTGNTGSHYQFTFNRVAANRVNLGISSGTNSYQCSYAAQEIMPKP
ncbi:hypothetical protein [Paenibacillus sp. ISL-20]|uniref:hypothetical protein n=1 Tax=Paenibacillus sp. ISL-20 TaxID=2819163 RepID=UPI001BE580A9|nr:hypothetical protein [Paenibacillus sp. ISL-20]MBT2761791.1 hypothetical protein [Paenibacillus sp. ISL-20]